MLDFANISIIFRLTLRREWVVAIVHAQTTKWHCRIDSHENHLNGMTMALIEMSSLSPGASSRCKFKCNKTLNSLAKFRIQSFVDRFDEIQMLHCCCALWQPVFQYLFASLALSLQFIFDIVNPIWMTWIQSICRELPHKNISFSYRVRLLPCTIAVNRCNCNWNCNFCRPCFFQRWEKLWFDWKLLSCQLETNGNDDDASMHNLIRSHKAIRTIELHEQKRERMSQATRL